MPELNKKAPDFELPDLDGNSHHLSDYLGKIVVVNFWSAECPQVERTDRALASYLAEWGNAAIVLPIAANGNESVEMLRNVSITRGLPIVLHDVGHVVADLYEAVTTPHTYVIDREGILRYRGAFDNVTFRQREATQSYLKDAVDTLLTRENPNPEETAPYGCTIVRL